MSLTKHKLGRSACRLLNPDDQPLRSSNGPGAGRRSPGAEAALAEPVPAVDFAAWQDWRGKDVARFLSAFTGLPQYSLAAERNLTGISLVELYQQGIINKGLSRAGIVDFDHLRQIAGDVLKLQKASPEELQKELELRFHVRQQKTSEEIDKYEKRLAKNPVKLKPLAKERVQIFHPDRAEEVVSPHWRFRSTHMEMQKSASEGALTQQFFSKVRITPAPNTRPAMGQSLAGGKANYESSVVVAIVEAEKAEKKAVQDARNIMMAQKRRDEQEKIDKKNAKLAVEEARRQDGLKKQQEIERRENEKAAEEVKKELRKMAQSEARAEEEKVQIKLAQESAKIEAAQRIKDALLAGLDPVDLAFKDMFELNDLDGSGFVDMHESVTTQRKMCAFLGCDFDEEEAKESFGQLDSNADGDISFEEFAKFSRGRFGDMPNEEILEIICSVNELIRAANKNA